MIRILLIGAAALVLAGCAMRQAETPAQQLFAAEAEFNIHQRGALAYVSQPECVVGVVVIRCADRGVKARIKTLIRQSTAALETAKATLRTSPGAPALANQIAIVAGLVRQFAAYLINKELTRGTTNRTRNPETYRLDRARRPTGARDHAALQNGV